MVEKATNRGALYASHAMREEGYKAPFPHLKPRNA
jgi:hypothetical protein